MSAAEIAAAFGTVKSDASAGDASFIADYSVEDANGNLVTSTLRLMTYPWMCLMLQTGPRFCCNACNGCG